MSKNRKKVSEAFSKEKNDSSLIIQLLIITILTSLTIFPFIFDSFTVSKLFIASFGLMLFSINFLRILSTNKLNILPRWLTLLLLSLIIAIVVSWWHSDMPFLRAAFGQFGRGNGLFYYYFVILIFIFAAKIFNGSSAFKMHQLISFLSWFLGLYAFLQKIGIDLAKLDTKDLSPVVLTYGNSNFAGGMLSMLFTYHFVYAIVAKKFQPQNIILLALLILSSTFAAAVQGYLIIFFAIFLGISIILSRQIKSVWVNKVLKAAWLLGIVSMALGVMGKFVLAPVFSRTSFQARIEYWRIAISIIKDNMIFGIGPDKLYDVSSNYMSPGTLSVITTTRMDNAHNWYLNFAVSYGVVSALFLILIFGSVFVCGFRQLKKFHSSDALSLASFSAFIAIFIDGLVSIEQPGIGIWLYFFAGIVIANYICDKNKSVALELTKRDKTTYISQKVFNAIVILNILCLCISTFVITNRILQDASLRSKVQTQLLGKGSESTLQNIASTAINLKAEPEYTVQALRPLAEVGAGSLIDEVSKVTYEFYPNSIQANLIRADVLRALGKLDEACPMRTTLVNNTPWEYNQIEGYVICLVKGKGEPNYLNTLRKISLYMYADERIEIPLSSSTSLDDLMTRFGKYAIAARLNFLLKNDERAAQEKVYGFELLTYIKNLEKSQNITVPQSKIREYLQVLEY